MARDPPRQERRRMRAIHVTGMDAEASMGQHAHPPGARLLQVLASWSQEDRIWVYHTPWRICTTYQNKKGCATERSERSELA